MQWFYLYHFLDGDLTIDQSRKMPEKHGCRHGIDIKFNGLEHENEVKWVLSNLSNTSEKLRLKMGPSRHG